MKKVIITGATSFIGIHLINKLIKNDYFIYCVVRKNTKKIGLLPVSEKIKIIHLDMEDYDKISNVIEDNCDIFFNLAWNGTRGTDRDNEEMQKSNYINSIKAVKSVINMNCKIIVTAGSQAEYGVTNKVITEETECLPLTQYGKYKLKNYEETYKICTEQNIRIYEPRFFSLYGENDYEETMIISTIKKMLNNDECNFTECNQNWSYLHVRDAVDGLLVLIDGNCESGIYNFAGKDTFELKEYILKMKRIINSNSKLNFGAIPYGKSGKVSFIPCIDKLIRCGWSPKVTFEEGIKEIVK